VTISRVLVANRGEIANRVIQTCRRLGIHTVLAMSEADLDSLPARLADEVVVIGPGPSAQSYLNVAAVVDAAVRAGVDALHPGYGFLSENAELARACAAAGVTFIGPDVSVLEAVGDKLTARSHAVAAGLPVVPGGEAATVTDAIGVAAEVGYPLLVKAVGGGGGRGMKRVNAAEDLPHTLELAMAEAQAAFGDPRVYIERYIESGRHIEVQVLGDGDQVIHLGDRDCSVQRRYQKLFEEAPAPLLDDATRAGLRAAAVTLATSLRYRGLGTVEFLYDNVRGEYYFLEMNARIQVEHPVTEMITGLDLVAEQLWVAENPLRLSQDDITFSGHALECRINAEDWHADFQPHPGTVGTVRLPVAVGVRIDTHMQTGATVPPYYDSLLAKVIVHAEDRPEAIELMRATLARLRIDGVPTTIGLHEALLVDDQVRRGGMDTAFFPQWFDLVRTGEDGDEQPAEIPAMPIQLDGTDEATVAELIDESIETDVEAPEVTEVETTQVQPDQQALLSGIIDMAQDSALGVFAVSGPEGRVIALRMPESDAYA
jgi:acetyl-CoA carboxylase, biotin carboxylase subunit